MNFDVDVATPREQRAHCAESESGVLQSRLRCPSTTRSIFRPAIPQSHLPLLRSTGDHAAIESFASLATADANRSAKVFRRDWFDHELSALPQSFDQHFRRITEIGDEPRPPEPA
jgi:hypothetical protein